jgi:hypothetical protein
VPDRATLEKEIEKGLAWERWTTLFGRLALMVAGVALFVFAILGVGGALHATSGSTTTVATSATTTTTVTTTPTGTTTTTTPASTTTTTVSSSSPWSDTLDATLLGTGLLLLLAGAFYARITGFTLPGGVGLTLSAQTDLVAALVKQLSELKSPPDPKTVRLAYLQSAVYLLDPASSTPAGSSQVAARRLTKLRASRGTKRQETVADAAVRQALSDLDLT